MKEKIENLISETLERYEFELPKDEYSVIANELSQKIVKLFAIHGVSKSVDCDCDKHTYRVVESGYRVCNNCNNILPRSN